MPHLLHFLGVEENAKVWDTRSSTPATLSEPIAGKCMDWGTLAVYTCPASCQTGAGRQPGELSPGEEKDVTRNGDNARAVEAYVEEFVWRQPPP